MVNFDCYESPLGMLWLTGREDILTGLSFEAPSGELQLKEFAAVKGWLDDYFLGNPRKIDFPMELSGTSFQMLIWKLLTEIPFGETRTYGQLACRAAQLLGRENMSAQAVGQAVGKNPIAILIPCHRVVGTDGKLTGYAYGLDKKQWLLTHEEKRR